MTTTHAPNSADEIYGPDTCPVCDTPPYPAGACLACGYSAPNLSSSTPLISKNNIPGIVFAGAVWLLVLTMLAALIWRWFLS